MPHGFLSKRLAPFLLVSSWFLLGGAGHAYSERVDPSRTPYVTVEGRRFRSPSGAELILRGINIGYSSHDPSDGPARPVWREGGPEAFRKIREWGYNCVRLVLYWSAVEPECGRYDESFLRDLDEKIEWAAQNDLYVILDMHQDLWGLGIPGARGAPRWALVDPSPQHVKGRSVWSEAYFTSPLVQTAFDNFWENRPGPDGVGIQDRFALMWQHVAERYADNSTVIGYDLLNEPFGGTPVTEAFQAMTLSLLPDLMEDDPGNLTLDPFELGRRVLGLAKRDIRLYRKWLDVGDPTIEKLDRERVMPMYNRVARAIRSVDPHHILFTSTTICSNFGLRNGIQRIVDEDGNPDPCQAFSPHIYDDDLERIELAFGRLAETAERLGLPLFIGEWGNLTNSDRIFERDPTEPTKRLVELFDAVGASHAYWYFMKDLDRQPYFRSILQRPYPALLSGTLETYSFDSAAGTFTCEWTEEPSRGGENRFYLPAVWYPETSPVEISPSSGSVGMIDDSGWLAIEPVGKSILNRKIEVSPPISGRRQPISDPDIIQLGIRNVGTTVIGHLEDRTLFITQGYRMTDKGRVPALECRTGKGELSWRIEGATPEYFCGEYLQWIDRGPAAEPLVLWTYFPNPQGGEGYGNQGGLYRVRDGRQVYRFPKASNNASFPLRLPTGEQDLIFSGQGFVQRFDLETLKPVWEFNDHVLFCWGYPVYLPELGAVAWGSEYDLPDGRSSSFAAVDLDGNLVWTQQGIREDIGSTPLFPVDVDSDGKRELVKNGLDLCGKNDLPFNHLHVLDLSGNIIRQIPSMMYSTGLADLDGDDRVEAFGVVCHRDGGTEARQRKEIRCVDLATGETEWETPVPRAGLPAANALAADVDGDGRLEALVADGNPVFYGHLEGPDWGAVYVLDASGTLIQTVDFPRWARRLAMCDWDRDGYNNLLVQVDGDPASLYLFETRAPATRDNWPLPFGSLEHWGAEHLRKE